MDKFRCNYGTLQFFTQGGSGGGETLILLHGLGASHSQFDFLSSSLTIAPKLVMVDLPGHGENRVASVRAASFDNFARSMMALCDHLDVRAATFVGLSMGASVSLICAAQRPELVQRLVLIRPSWLASAAPEHLAIIDRCGLWLAGGDPVHAIANLEADAEYQEILQDVPLAAASIRGVLERARAVEHAAVLRAIFRDRPFSSLNELRAIKVHATVVGTHADRLHPVSIANATTNALPNAKLRILPPRYLRPQDHAAELTKIIFNTHGVAA